MTDPVEFLDAGCRDRWEAAFSLLPAQLRDIHFTYDYQYLYERNGDGKMFLYTYRENSEIYYYPFLIRAVPGDPEGHQDIETAYGYTGPVSTSHDPAFHLRASEAFLLYCRKEKVVSEFIRFHPLLGNHMPEIPSVTVVPLRDYVWVDLKQTADQIRDRYTPANRNKIRKAEKAGLRVVADTELKEFDVFVRIYLENMRQLHAQRMYYFSDAYFAGLKELCASQGALLLAKQEDEVLGGALFFGGDRIAHYFLAAATPEGKKIAAGNLLLHEGINWCRSAGSEKLHLGGGLSASAEDPLLLFKKNFSPLTEKFYIGKRIHDRPAYERLCNAWDLKFAPDSERYRNILQRYRWTKDDLL